MSGSFARSPSIENTLSVKISLNRPSFASSSLA